CLQPSAKYRRVTAIHDSHRSRSICRLEASMQTCAWRRDREERCQNPFQFWKRSARFAADLSRYSRQRWKGYCRQPRAIKPLIPNLSIPWSIMYHSHNNLSSEEFLECACDIDEINIDLSDAVAFQIG